VLQSRPLGFFGVEAVMKVRSLAIFVVAVVIARLQQGPVSTQPATAAYLITDLRTLGGACSEALAISELTQIAGSAQRSDGTTHAFFFDGQSVSLCFSDGFRLRGGRSERTLRMLEGRRTAD
jgi:hypothetical protein